MSTSTSDAPTCSANSAAAGAGTATGASTAAGTGTATAAGTAAQVDARASSSDAVRPEPLSASAERRKPRFICEYTYTNELLTHFAQLQTSAKRRGALLLMGCIEIAIGLIWIFTPHPLHWAGAVFVALGLYCLWYRSNMYQKVAQRYIRSMEQDESGMGGRYRRIVVTDEAVTVFARDDRSQRYEFSELAEFQHDDVMFVAVFGVNGVAFPLDSFVLGTPSAFGEFLAAKRYPAGSMGPDTPNRGQ